MLQVTGIVLIASYILIINPHSNPMMKVLIIPIIDTEENGSRER